MDVPAEYILVLYDREKENVYLGMRDCDYQGHIDKLMMLEDMMDEHGIEYERGGR